MTRKYAILVKQNDGQELYEIFDVIYITDTNINIFNRWKNGFSNGSVTVIPIANIEKVSMGSYLSNESFIFNENEQEIPITDDRAFFGFTSDNLLFGMLAFEIDSFEHNKYSAATSQKVIGLDITDQKNIGKTIGLGYIWDNINNIFLEG